MQAGELLKQRASDSYDVMEKTQKDDLVTSVDLEIQAFLTTQIKDTYSEDKILAEEGDEKIRLNQGNVWVIDPIDGTVNFITQKSDFAIMLSYFIEGEGQFGLIYDVMGNKLYSGGQGIPATCNDDLLPFFDGRLLTDSLVACNSGMLLNDIKGICRHLRPALGIRNYGCAGISAAKVLENQLWGYFSNLYPWDYAAAAIIGKQLGYQLFTLDGEEPDYESRQEVMFIPEKYNQFLLSTNSLY